MRGALSSALSGNRGAAQLMGVSLVCSSEQGNNDNDVSLHPQSPDSHFPLPTLRSECCTDGRDGRDGGGGGVVN